MDLFTIYGKYIHKTRRANNEVLIHRIHLYLRQAFNLVLVYFISLSRNLLIYKR